MNEHGKLQKFGGWLRRRANVLVPAGLFVALLLVQLFIFFTAVVPATHRPIQVELPHDSDLMVYTEAPVAPGDTLSQSFSWQHNVASVTFPVQGARAHSDMALEYALYDETDGQLLAQHSITLGRTSKTADIELPFEGFPHSPTGAYRLEVTFIHLAEDLELQVGLLPQGGAAALHLNGTPLAGALFTNILSTSTALLGYFWVIAIPLLLLVPGLWLLIFVVKVKIHTLFLLAAVVLGFCYSLAFTPYSHEDEAHHIPLTFYYSDKLMGGETRWNAETSEYEWEMRAEDAYRGLTSREPRQATYHYIARHFFEMDAQPGATTTMGVQIIGRVYQYFPQILGVTLARLLGLGQVPTLYLGAWFGLLAYAGVAYAAIRLVPQKLKTLFFLAGLFPIFLNTGASFSYDNSINALCLFFTAYVLHLAFVRPRVTLPHALLLLAVAALIVPLKMIYIPLLLLVFIIPRKKFAFPHLPRAVRVLLLVGLAACVVLVVLYAIRLVSGYVYLFSVEEARTPWREEAHTLSSLLRQPWELLRLVAATAIDRFDVIFTAPGHVQFFSLPSWASAVMLGMMLLSVFPLRDETPLPLRPRQKVVMALCFLLVYGLGLAAALTWTPVGDYYIKGAQGRYFVALIPLLAMLFYGAMRRRKNSDRWLQMGIVLLNVYGVLYLFLLAAFGATRQGLLILY